jgi:hypothetical protein
MYNERQYARRADDDDVLGWYRYHNTAIKESSHTLHILDSK